MAETQEQLPPDGQAQKRSVAELRMLQRRLDEILSRRCQRPRAVRATLWLIRRMTISRINRAEAPTGGLPGAWLFNTTMTLLLLAVLLVGVLELARAFATLWTLLFVRKVFRLFKALWGCTFTIGRTSTKSLEEALERGVSRLEHAAQLAPESIREDLVESATDRLYKRAGTPQAADRISRELARNIILGELSNWGASALFGAVLGCAASLEGLQALGTIFQITLQPLFSTFIVVCSGLLGGWVAAREVRWRRS
jgi:hypothetical protein